MTAQRDKLKKKEAKVLYTPSELKVEAVYHEPPRKTQKKLSKAGEYPYTRGIHSDMYRGKLWTMRQYAGFGTAREANERYRYLLQRGTTGLSVAFDLPTQMGRDSDHPLAKGEVGKVGVAISSVEDMEVLLKDIPLEKVSISMTINATASILLAFLLVVAERRKTPWGELTGTVQNDILKEYIARGTYIYPPKQALRLVTDLFQFCGKHVPKWNTVSISGYHIREAGSTAVQELAYTLADGIAYVKAALSAGLKIDDFAPRLAFFFNCHNDFLEEIAKFRAAREMWATIMRTRFKAKDPRSMMLRFHTQTAGSSLTAQQPLNNVVRTTVQALAAVLGGTQSLHTNSYDEALSLPTEESASLALRTQQIIAHESGVAASVDPLGGSYLIESWTARLRDLAFKEIEKISELGGMVRAIEQRYPQGEIEKAAYRYQRRIEDEEQIVVGVNRFVEESREVPAHTIDPKGERDQVRRLSKLKKSRDGKAVASSLKALKKGAEGGHELMALIVSSARVGATLGEIADVFRGVFGEFR